MKTGTMGMVVGFHMRNKHVDYTFYIAYIINLISIICLLTHPMLGLIGVLVANVIMWLCFTQKLIDKGGG